MKIFANTNIYVSIMLLVSNFYMTTVLARGDATVDKQLCKNLLMVTIEKYSTSYKEKLKSIKTQDEFNSSVKFIYDDVLNLEKKSKKCVRVNSEVYGDMSTKEKFNKVMIIIREAGEVHKVTSGLRVQAEYYVSSKLNNNKKHFKYYVTMLNENIDKNLNDLMKLKTK